MSEDEKRIIGTIQIRDFREYPLYNTGFADATLVVNERYYEQLKRELRPAHVFIYDVTEVEHSEELGNKLQLAVEGKVSIWSDKMSSYYSNYHIVSILTGTILFIGVFISIVFFLATGSIIYFKQVTDGYSEAPQFDTLFKLGLSDQELRRVVAGQIAPMFIVPLLFGISHSAFAMAGLSLNFEVEVKLPLVIVTSIYCVFYGLYYWITVNSYTNIVSRHRPH
ncbi:putative ABC transporter permease [Listeria floridensis FSL S10-1187]|uniref:ABC transporter permease n=1 Tax=Listeria floridensis FSL S10-1187 TaxID=1265817 RepID=A0ABN0RDG6_9LIST|nr:FtsX-like permease family protein [Listeria floridensis]EUJ29178.1 putative ABC transporter permease [Listeria floridensis FSL S10-1187]